MTENCLFGKSVAGRFRPLFFPFQYEFMKFQIHSFIIVWPLFGHPNAFFSTSALSTGSTGAAQMIVMNLPDVLRSIQKKLCLLAVSYLGHFFLVVFILGDHLNEYRIPSLCFYFFGLLNRLV